MVDAVSSSTSSYRGVPTPLEQASSLQVDRKPAVTALAALAAPVPVTRVSAPSDLAESNDVAFLYTASGRPETAATPAYAVPPAQETTDERVADSRNPTARLAMESTQLTTLLSSLMTPSKTSVEETAAPPAETDGTQLSRLARQPVIAQLYSQF